MEKYNFSNNLYHHISVIMISSDIIIYLRIKSDSQNYFGSYSAPADSSWVSGETDERLLYLQPLSYDDAMEICRIFGANLLKKIDEKAKIMMKLKYA